jgi:heterodisulfide reductase subunit A
MTAALSLARQGYDTHLVERSDQLGGQANSLYRTWKGEDIQAHLAELVARVNAEDRLQVHLDTQLASVDGFVGNFKTVLKNNSRRNRPLNMA